MAPLANPIPLYHVGARGAAKSPLNRLLLRRGRFMLRRNTMDLYNSILQCKARV